MSVILQLWDRIAGEEFDYQTLTQKWSRSVVPGNLVEVLLISSYTAAIFIVISRLWKE
jgi:hypothetical protein